jgi:hypothetical protein
MPSRDALKLAEARPQNSSGAVCLLKLVRVYTFGLQNSRRMRHCGGVFAV